jgi:serine/threonine-protein kinase RsbT
VTAGADEQTRVEVTVTSDSDVVTARLEGRSLASEIGFPSTELALIATAISEVARNLVAHAGRGTVVITAVDGPAGAGIEVVAHDNGPGIADIDRAMQDGFTTGDGLGLGLPGARRLMDEFEITSALGQGTTVRMAKWVSAR